MKSKLFMIFISAVIAGMNFVFFIQGTTIALFPMAAWIGSAVTWSFALWAWHDRKIAEVKRSQLDRQRYPIRFS